MAVPQFVEGTRAWRVDRAATSLCCQADQSRSCDLVRVKPRGHADGLHNVENFFSIVVRIGDLSSELIHLCCGAEERKRYSIAVQWERAQRSGLAVEHSRLNMTLQGLPRWLRLASKQK